MFKDTRIIEKRGGINPLKPIHTFGWKFEYKERKYVNFISDQKPTGKYRKVSGYDDDGEYYEGLEEIYKIVPITPQAQIALMKNMVASMEEIIKKK